jgi:two-component system, OmpR family, response regulator
VKNNHAVQPFGGAGYLPFDRVSDPAVLIVEDDAALGEEMAIALRRHGMIPTLVTDWDQAIQTVGIASFDMIVLDQRLGAIDAVARLPRLRVLTPVPILVLTANQAEADRILALETGADDFLLKPISGRELVARIRAHMRRAAGGPTEARPAIARPRWRVSLSERRLIRPNGDVVPLTGTEFELLATLLETPGHPVSRDTLTRRVLGRPWRSEERAIDNLVLHLRQKLGPGGDQSIVTIRNQGYAFSAFPDP